MQDAGTILLGNADFPKKTAIMPESSGSLVRALCWGWRHEVVAGEEFAVGTGRAHFEVVAGDRMEVKRATPCVEQFASR